MPNRMQADRMTTLDGVTICRRCRFPAAKTNPFTSIDDGLSPPSPLARVMQRSHVDLHRLTAPQYA